MIRQTEACFEFIGSIEKTTIISEPDDTFSVNISRLGMRNSWLYLKRSLKTMAWSQKYHEFLIFGDIILVVRHKYYNTKLLEIKIIE